MSWPTTNQVQRANAGVISVAPVGHTAAQTTETHPPIGDPPEAQGQAQTVPLLEAARVVTAPPRATTQAAATAIRVHTGEETLPRPRVALRVVTVDPEATVRRVVTATVAVVAPRVEARAMVEGTRATARSAPHGVNATAATRVHSRTAWTSPMFQRTSLARLSIAMPTADFALSARTTLRTSLVIW